MSTELKRFSDKDILVIDEIPQFNTPDYDLMDEKDFKKYLDDCEKIIRKSFEYTEFISYLRNYMDMNKCSFFQYVNNIDTFKIKIHIHHCPFSLFDIVRTVFNKRCFYHEPVEIEMVAKEVMYLHYFLMIGLIPLAETVHTLVHKQIIFIPLNKVCGNYEYFYDTYSPHIPDDAKDRFENMKLLTKTYNEAKNIEILKQEPMLIEIPHTDGSGTYNLASMEGLIKLINRRVMELKENQNRIGINNIVEPDNLSTKNEMYAPFYKVENKENKMYAPFYKAENKTYMPVYFVQ